MSILIDPTAPTDGSSPRQGAADIRAVTAELQKMFGGAGSAPLTYTVAPLISDTTTGLSTVPANPTTGLGIATKQYVDAGVVSPYHGIASGTNTYAVTLSPVPANLAALNGIPITVIFTNANTGAVTLNTNGFGAVNLIKNNVSALKGGEIVGGEAFTIIYDGTNFQFAGRFPQTFTFAKVTVDQTVSSTALVNVNGMNASITYPTDYWAFQGFLYVTVNTSGLNLAVTTPGGGAALAWNITTGGGSGIGTTSGTAATAIAASGTGTGSYSVTFQGSCFNGSAAGNIQLQFSTNSGTTATTIKAGSYMIGTRLA